MARHSSAPQLPDKTRTTPESYNSQFRTLLSFRSAILRRHPVDDLPDKPAKPEKDKPNKSKKPSSGSSSGVSRRDFLKISGVSAAVPLVSQVSAFALAEGQLATQGPGK